jgi:hypothetical protein
MTTPGTDNTSASQAAQEDAARARDAFSREAGSAREEGKKAVGTAGEEASRLAEAAKHRAGEAIEDQKETVADSMGDFAAAIRKASDELGGRDQSMAASMVREVAQGLEQASRSIHGQNIQDLTRSVASFARRQPTAFLLGAALAGVALGRFARSSGEHLHEGHASAGARGFDNRSGGRGTATSSSAPATTEVHGYVSGAVPTTAPTAVSGGTNGD